MSSSTSSGYMKFYVCSSNKNESNRIFVVQEMSWHVFIYLLELDCIIFFLKISFHEHLWVCRVGGCPRQPIPKWLAYFILLMRLTVIDVRNNIIIYDLPAKNNLPLERNGSADGKQRMKAVMIKSV